MLAPLVAELLGHYAMAPAGASRIEAALAAQPAGVEVLAAFVDGSPAGFASFAQIFPGLGIAPQIYMKELYVGAAHRSARLGERIMRALAVLARERGCTRVDWTTQRDNAGACAFYRRIGARAVEEKIYFRLDEAGLAAPAATEQA